MMTTTAAPGLTAPQTHLDAFSAAERTLPGHNRPAIARLRSSAIAAFAKLGFPNDRNEDWKFTSVKPLVRTPMLLPEPDSPEAIEAFRSRLVHTGPGVTLACFNRIAPFLMGGSQPLPEGVLVCSLAEAIQSHPDLVEAHFARHAASDEHPFVALNSAFWNQGAFVYVPPGVIIDEPIQIDYVVSAYNEDYPYLWYRRALILLGKAAQATVVESFYGLPMQYATNAVSEIVLGEGAILDHYKVQQESPQAFHLACTQAVVAAKANFSTHYVGLGGQLVRNEVRVLFTGQHAEATVNGLYQTSGTQHLDNLTVIDHAQPNCNSHELYKGVLDGKSKGVFAGKIFVRPDAQKTDAKQTNKTLLLSDDATINSKPQLEIFADDVKCTHGATVGQLDEQQLFYLRARGIGEEQARALLTFAFANDIVRRIKVDPLRLRLETLLLESSHLPRLTETEDE